MLLNRRQCVYVGTLISWSNRVLISMDSVAGNHPWECWLRPQAWVMIGHSSSHVIQQALLLFRHREASSLSLAVHSLTGCVGCVWWVIRIWGWDNGHHSFTTALTWELWVFCLTIKLWEYLLHQLLKEKLCKSVVSSSSPCSTIMAIRFVLFFWVQSAFITTYDVFWYHLTLGTCYQLVQFVFKIGFVLAKKGGKRGSWVDFSMGCRVHGSYSVWL